jgi:hypothetical protein
MMTGVERRAQRQGAIRRLLETNGVVTAEAMAAEVGVDIRTVYRVIKRMRLAGHDIIGGRGLGYMLRNRRAGVQLMAFAAYTKVPVEKTRMEIEKLVVGRGARSFATFLESSRGMIAFQLAERNIRFVVPIPPKMKDQEIRSRWRALFLVIKAKLEGIDAGIETIEEAFLAHVVTPTGRTVMEEIREPLKLQYSGQQVPLLPGPGK